MNTQLFNILHDDMRNTSKALQLHPKPQWLLQKAPVFELQAGLAGFVFVFFIEHHFLSERTTDRQTRMIQTWAFGRHFLKKEPSEPVTSGKTTESICCQ